MKLKDRYEIYNSIETANKWEKKQEQKAQEKKLDKLLNKIFGIKD